MAQAKLQGSNINLVKQHNLHVILLSLLYEPVLSRSQLAKHTNLSNTTITNLIAELIEQGIVTEKNTADEEQEELRPVGRPRTRICLEPNARFVVGIHIGVGTFRVAITNLRAEIIDNLLLKYDISSPALDVLEQIVTSVETVIDKSGVERNKILGVGVGASGLVDFTTGVNLLAPNLDWHDVPLREHLQNKLQLPVIVDNNVRTMAIGETYFGAGRGVDSVAFVYGRIGVGAGLTFKGQVFRGSSKGAGEIGHSAMLLQGGEPCRCGNSGCLETLVSESVIVQQAEDIAKSNPDGILANIFRENTDNSPIECVFEAARRGDNQVQEMIEERGCYLGIALANLINMFNPELILLGGIFSRGEDLFKESITRTIQQRAFGGMGKNVRVQATSFGWKAGVIGAAALALLHFFYQHAEDWFI
jgi:glucokinase-like ROK family protein